MSVKPTLFAVIAAACILAVPAVASASELTGSEGEPIPVGTLVEGVSTNMTLETELGLIECAEVTVAEEVTINNGTTVEGVSSGEGESTECFSEGSPLGLTDHTMINWTTVLTQLGSATMTQVYHLPIGISCHFEGRVTFTFVSGSDIMSINSGQLVGSPAICGNANLNGNFTFKKPNGQPVIFK